MKEQITMAEKFRKNVAVPEELAKKLRKFIEKKEVVKTIKERRQKRESAGIKDKNAKFVDAAGIFGLGAVKWSAWLAAGGAQFLLTLARWLTMDNAFLRKMEKNFSDMTVGKNKKGKPKKVSSFAKKYPNLSAHILWLLGLTAVSGATYVGVEHGQDIAQIVNELKLKITSVKFKDFKVDPRSDEQAWQKMIDAVHPYVLSHIVSSEGFIKKLYDDNFGHGTLTIGSGFALMDREHREFGEKVLGRRLGNGVTINIEENRTLVSAWLYKKVYPQIKNTIKVPMESDLFVILAVAGYNKGPNVYDTGNSGAPVASAVNERKNKEEIAKEYVRCFGGTQETKWPGLANKYAVLALYYLGYVDDITILDAIGEAPYTLNKKLLIYESAAKTAKAKDIIRPKNIKEMLLATKIRKTKGTFQRPVRNYLTAEQVGLIENGYVAINDKTINFTEFFKQPKEEKKESSKTEILNAEGEDFFFDGKYDKAVKKFHAALEADPTNYIVYSNLALSYYKMGKPERGLAVVQELIKSDFMKSMPDDIKGYTYYNAALCRVAIGDRISNAKGKRNQYQMALKNLNLAKKFSGNDYKELTHKLNKVLSKGRGVIKVAFNRGTGAIKNKDKQFMFRTKSFSENLDDLG